MSNLEPSQPIRGDVASHDEEVVTAEAVPDDADVLLSVLKQSTSKNRLPPEEYLAGSRRLWNYSEMPNVCPQCDHKFHHRDHPRWIRKSTCLLAALAYVGAVLGKMFAGPAAAFPFIEFVPPVLVLLLLPKAVYFRCPRCQWNKKFIVRTGRG